MLVERAPTDELWALPLHPYTEALLAADPRQQLRSLTVHYLDSAREGVAEQVRRLREEREARHETTRQQNVS